MTMADNEDNRGPMERAYDDEIAPLMKQIIAACKRAGIPMIAQFQLDEKDNGEPLYCTTNIVPAFGAVASDHIKGLANRLRPPGPVCLAETHVTLPDGSKQITIKRMS
jgi:hypothetical protein